ncbi:isocitrate/isopropylmalate dehydrogenase family protein [Gordonia neofelifaecis]|uniref:3-isopropylmalate dehydrogenase n=1 Tax=Gordonia neofelifaecis NRRL B-59395 TaxID=644548 RepID=F1YH32_9ACTN|nr:isocitrate/isopropylmalate family dehydrogenase [Gordonia neofelifaecis]EGD55947.1 3-isopropylmalate dehydrogenase [Gordonia neofelifaecis NRRL B-59395]
MTDTLRIAVLPGDGIGPEVVPVAVDIATRALADQGVSLDQTTLPYGASAIAADGVPVPASTLEALEDFDLWAVGPHDSASYPAEVRYPAPGAVLRKQFGLYANLRPARAVRGVDATAPDIDVLVVRENSEGLYADRNMTVGSGEFMPTPDVAMAVGLVTRTASERIAVEAFEAARRRRGHVTVVHKANVLRLTTGLFRDVCLDVATRYPDVRVDDQHVDAMAALLVRRPADFDVLVTENLFGDILSDLAAELSGSLGLASSINTSATQAMAQAVHGAAPDIAGTGVANPVAMIGSMAMLLRWHARRSGDGRVDAAADAIDGAVAHVLAEGVATADLGGSASTSEFGAAVVEQIG